MSQLVGVPGKPFSGKSWYGINRKKKLRHKKWRRTMRCNHHW